MLKRNLLDQILKENNLDCIIITSKENRYWLSEFASSDGLILYFKKNSYIFLDGRYITDGKEKVKNIENIVEIKANNKGGLYQQVLDIVNENAKSKKPSIGFEEEYTTYDMFLNYKKIFKDYELTSVPVNSIRGVKTSQEIEIIKKACEITDKTFEKLTKFAKPNMKEIEIAKFIYNSFIDLGASSLSFNSIVASGERGALPHGRASEKLINDGDFVTVDFGCVFENYTSDMTRTFIVGDHTKNKNYKKMKEIFEVVREAQRLGTVAITEGMESKAIDKICRDYITSKGYGEYFVHSTGHGLGIEVHEFPRVSPFVSTPLKAGMVITVEPGIYIPGVGGVRIEDDILVKKNGYEILTKSTKKLITTNGIEIE